MRKIFVFAVLIFILSANLASAAALSIDTQNRYAWGENVGWLDFGSSQGNVQVGDTQLTGYAWGENTGWVSLNCSNTSSCGTVSYGVTNDGVGNLSGYAYGENVGWISFNCSNTSSCGTVNYGVTVSNNVFSGYAYGENIGWVSFNCSNTSSCGTVNYFLADTPAQASNVPTSSPSVVNGMLPSGTPGIKTPINVPEKNSPINFSPKFPPSKFMPPAGGAAAISNPASQNNAQPPGNFIQNTLGPVRNIFNTIRNDISATVNWTKKEVIAPIIYIKNVLVAVEKDAGQLWIWIKDRIRAPATSTQIQIPQINPGASSSIKIQYPDWNIPKGPGDILNSVQSLGL